MGTSCPQELLLKVKEGNLEERREALQKLKVLDDINIAKALEIIGTEEEGVFKSEILSIYEIKDEKSLGEGTNRGGSNGDDSAPPPKIGVNPPDSPASMPRKLKSRKKEVEDSR